MRSRKAFSSPVTQAAPRGKPTFPGAAALPLSAGAAALRSGRLLPGDPPPRGDPSRLSRPGGGQEGVREEAEAEPVQLGAEELGGASRL